MAILVTGGAGYIGSVTAARLRENGEEIVVLDDLIRGHRAALEAGVPFYQGRVGDGALLERITREHKIDSCIHFAALAYVGESVEKPSAYFENNVEQGVALMRSLLDAGVRHLLFFHPLVPLMASPNNCPFESKRRNGQQIHTVGRSS